MKKDEKQEVKAAIKKAVEECQSELKETKKDAKDEVKTIEELTALLQRVQADFDNYRKRVEREKQDLNFFFKKEMVSSLLPVLDMFELALKYTNNNAEFVKGVQMIYAQFLATLENEGLKLIGNAKQFNPSYHEAVMIEDGEEDGVILEELQKGYMLIIQDSLLRACCCELYF